MESALALIPDASGRDLQERITALDRSAGSHRPHRQRSCRCSPLRGALMAAADDKDAGELWRAWINRDIRQPACMVLAELASKRVIRRDFDLDEVLEQLLGPFWHRICVTRAPIREGFCPTRSASPCASIPPSDPAPIASSAHFAALRQTRRE
ncbi:MAG: TetR-like C-terminal domain-containing protein [Hyphomonas sp.]